MSYHASNTARCRYNVVIFLPNPHKRHPNLFLWLQHVIKLCPSRYSTVYNVILDCKPANEKVNASMATFDFNKCNTLRWWIRGGCGGDNLCACKQFFLFKFWYGSEYMTCKISLHRGDFCQIRNFGENFFSLVGCFRKYWNFRKRVNTIWPWWSRLATLICIRLGSWLRHPMETFPPLLVICAVNSPVTGEFPAQSEWRGALIFSLFCAWINAWVNNREAGDLKRHRAHYDVIVTVTQTLINVDSSSIVFCEINHRAIWQESVHERADF